MMIAMLACVYSAFATTDYGQMSGRSQKVRIANVTAKLFYDTDGKFSDDVFSGKVNLWNTVLEGSSRDGSSSAMLIVVEIEAYGDGNPPKQKQVELTAKYRIANGTLQGRAANFHKIVPADIRTNGKSFSGFWIYETGCYPLELKARIVGQKNVLTKKINLGCGE
ncbi:MAG: hypothetical protein IPO41_16400 [Acidobacteria bacterium]|nr:hypothetical protein [Acidobacteriota bacterium]